jgi:hypothetical protein
MRRDGVSQSLTTSGLVWITVSGHVAQLLPPDRVLEPRQGRLRGQGRPGERIDEPFLLIRLGQYSPALPAHRMIEKKLKALCVNAPAHPSG